MTKLWQKNYSLDKAVEAFTVGNDYILDQTLVKHDAKASIAHAEMLKKVGLLSNKEFSQIKKVLQQIISLAEKGKFEIKQTDEDCHTAIENFLTRKIGEAGKKIHTARSRNDQVIAAIRLYLKDEISTVKKLVAELLSALKSFEKKYGRVKIPGYTHMQKAMPSSIGLWIKAFSESLEDDLKLLEAAAELIDQCPLGSAAGYGVPVLKIDRKFVAKKLGFGKVQDNVLYVQNSRGKFELVILNALQAIMLDLNKLATDLMLFSTSEFGYLSLPAEFCTGSSIMPQKKNHDVVELLRAKTAMFSGYSYMIILLITNLPSGYNRDLQLTKQPLIEGVELAKNCLKMAAEIIKKLKVNKENCEAAVLGSKALFATETAYKLVKKGTSFREAYRAVAASLK